MKGMSEKSTVAEAMMVVSRKIIDNIPRSSKLNRSFPSTNYHMPD